MSLNRGIYVWHNNREDKRYVGRSFTNVGQRALSHTYSKADGLLADALRLYPISDFTLTFHERPRVFDLEICKTEIAFIIELNSIYPNGYNSVMPTLVDNLRDPSKCFFEEFLKCCVYKHLDKICDYCGDSTYCSPYCYPKGLSLCMGCWGDFHFQFGLPLPKYAYLGWSPDSIDCKDFIISGLDYLVETL